MLDLSSCERGEYLILATGCDILLQMARANAYNQDTLVNREFGIQVADDLTLVDARILPAPMVIMCHFVLFVRALWYFQSPYG